jgi:adenylate cyclase 2
LLLLIVVAVLHTLDRQGEFVSRTDFLWKAKLKVEQEEVETMRGINKVSGRVFYVEEEDGKTSGQC